jgi:hypothetical protein
MAKKKRVSPTEKRRRGIAVRLKQPTVREKVHKFGQKQLKGGTHPQMWRAGSAGGRLGPMGELGDDVIIEMKFRHAIKFVFETTPLSERKVKTFIEDSIYTPLEDFLGEKINTWVPKDTGNLRRRLLGVINEGFSSIDRISTNIPFRVEVGTPGVPYAKVVNKMPKRWLQHPGGHPSGTKGRRGKVLYDPDAKKGWYSLLLLNGRRKATKLYKDFLKNDILPILRGQPGFTKNPVSKVRTLFSVKFK